MTYTGKRDGTLDDYGRRVVWDPEFKDVVQKYRERSVNLPTVRVVVFRIVRRVLAEQEREREK